MGKFMGPSFITLEEAKKKNILRRGDAIQIRRSVTYMHTILFKDYDNCYHVVEPDQLTNCSSLSSLIKAGTIGAQVCIARHSLEDILYSGERDKIGNPIGQPKFDKFRVNNQEDEARYLMIDLDLCKSDTYLDQLFADLDERILLRDEDNKEIPVPYHVLKFNCDCYVYGWKYGESWSPQTIFWRKVGIAAVHIASSVINVAILTQTRGAVVRTVITGVLSTEFPVIIVVWAGINVAYLVWNNWDSIAPHLKRIKDLISKQMRNSLETVLILTRQ